MKKIVGLVFLVMIAVTSLHAQKFGFIDSQALIAQMPETKVAQDTLQKFVDGKRNELKDLDGELQKMLKEYQSLPESTSKAVRQLKESQMMELQQVMQNYQTEVQKQIQEKQEKVFGPVLDKVKKAIESVGKENSFIFIFEISETQGGSQILYYSKEKAEDVTPLVKKKLGL